MQKRTMKSWAMAGAVALAVTGSAAFAGDEEWKSSSDVPMQHDSMSQDSSLQQPETNVNVNVDADDSDAQIAMQRDQEKQERKKWLSASRGGNYPVQLKVGGGVEGQTEVLADRMASGPMWSAALSAQPLNFLGIEAAYTGSTHEIDNNLTGAENDGAVNGADFVRNGGQIAATLAIPTPVIQPYAIGGVGIDRYDFRGATAGFQDDTAGRAPVGGGIRAAVGPVVADARATYNVLFDQEFIPDVGNTQGGTYDVGLHVGARF